MCVWGGKDLHEQLRDDTIHTQTTVHATELWVTRLGHMHLGVAQVVQGLSECVCGGGKICMSSSVTTPYTPRPPFMPRNSGSLGLDTCTWGLRGRHRDSG